NGGAAYTMLGLHRTLREQYEVEQRAIARGMLLWTTASGFFRLGTALGLALGGYLFQLNLVTIGTVYIIVNYSAMLQKPLRLLAQQLQDMQRAVAGAVRVQEMYFIQPTITDPPGPAQEMPAGP